MELASSEKFQCYRQHQLFAEEKIKKRSCDVAQGDEQDTDEGKNHRLSYMTRKESTPSVFQQLSSDSCIVTESFAIFSDKILLSCIIIYRVHLEFNNQLI